MLIPKAPIDYQKFAHAISFYKKHGVQYLELPWSVPPEYCEATRPPQGTTTSLQAGALENGEHLVASGEQSFLYMVDQGVIKEGIIYMGLTPCFRLRDSDGDLHSPVFMKLELFSLGSDLCATMKDLAIKCFRFLGGRYFQKVMMGENAWDINHQPHMENPTELGSYGIRQVTIGGKEFHWSYGTGLAEPRFSQTLETIKSGYHKRLLPKGKVGDYSKILEEFFELHDAWEQNSSVLMLCELSDMYGAMKAFLENHHPSITMGDLEYFSNATKNAFLSGSRK